jgi:hypothetical protein
MTEAKAKAPWAPAKTDSKAALKRNLKLDERTAQSLHYVSEVLGLDEINTVRFLVQHAHRQIRTGKFLP